MDLAGTEDINLGATEGASLEATEDASLAVVAQVAIGAFHPAAKTAIFTQPSNSPHVQQSVAGNGSHPRSFCAYKNIFPDTATTWSRTAAGVHRDSSSTSGMDLWPRSSNTEVVAGATPRGGTVATILPNAGIFINSSSNLTATAPAITTDLLLRVPTLISFL